MEGDWIPIKWTNQDILRPGAAARVGWKQSEHVFHQKCQAAVMKLLSLLQTSASFSSLVAASLSSRSIFFFVTTVVLKKTEFKSFLLELGKTHEGEEEGT